jgi:uncharacterized HAD superfamily protein
VGKPALFLDIDGVLAFQPEGDILAVNARFGSTWLAADVTTYPFSSMLPEDQAGWLAANWPVIAANLAPDTRAVRVAQKAAKAGYTVGILTERDPALRDLTAAWLKFWQVPYATLGVVGPGGKGAVLESYGKGAAAGNAVLVDDSPVNIDLARPGVDVWQPARPYNSGGNGVHRFNDWREFTKALGLKR